MSSAGLSVSSAKETGLPQPSWLRQSRFRFFARRENGVASTGNKPHIDLLLAYLPIHSRLASLTKLGTE